MVDCDHVPELHVNAVFVCDDVGLNVQSYWFVFQVTSTFKFDPSPGFTESVMTVKDDNVCDDILVTILIAINKMNVKDLAIMILPRVVYNFDF